MRLYSRRKEHFDAFTSERFVREPRQTSAKTLSRPASHSCNYSETGNIVSMERGHHVVSEIWIFLKEVDLPSGQARDRIDEMAFGELVVEYLFEANLRA